jgi:hypothetical protein
MKRLLVAALFTVALEAHAADPMRANRRLTPGDALSNVTVEEITAKGYADKRHGGARNVPETVKRRVFIEYFGRVPANPGGYEVDHLISLELGGSNDIKNLWPQSYNSAPYNAHVKDKLEDRMAALVRDELRLHGHGAATKLLKKFQGEIARDWVAAYHKYVSKRP